MGRDHASVDIAVAWLECGHTPKEGVRVAERCVMGRKDPEIVGEAGNGLDIYIWQLWSVKDMSLLLSQLPVMQISSTEV